MRVERAMRGMVTVALVVLGFGVPAWAQNVGAIRGTIQDTSGAVLPGVTIVLSNPGVIGGNQQAVTDERGAYQFTNLIPSGTYAVRAELTGFRAVSIDQLVVNASATVRADVTMQLGQVAEEVTVSAQVPLLDTSTVANQTVLDRKTLETLPTSNDIWSIGRIVPSVIMSRYDVGGSESLSQYQGSVHGSRWTDSGYLVDGLDTTNPSGTTSASYFDVAMFQETNYMAGNAGAEFEKGGLVYNLVSKTGTNAFHGWTNLLRVQSRNERTEPQPAAEGRPDRLRARARPGGQPRFLTQHAADSVSGRLGRLQRTDRERQAVVRGQR